MLAGRRGSWVAGRDGRLLPAVTDSWMCACTGVCYPTAPIGAAATQAHAFGERPKPCWRKEDGRKATRYLYVCLERTTLPFSLLATDGKLPVRAVQGRCHARRCYGERDGCQRSRQVRLCDRESEV